MELRATILVLAIAAGLLTVFAYAGWPGTPNHCALAGDCYCEAPQAGPIAQPANTWSLLGFALAGIWVAWRSKRDREHTSAPYFADRLYPTLYAGIVAFMGPGGAFLHASLTDWGGAVDVLSMFAWVCFLLYYNLRSLYGWSRSRFLAVYCVTIVIAITPRLLFGPAGLPLFSFLLLLWLASEALIGRSAGTLKLRWRVERQRRYLWASILINLVALFIWSGSHAGRWLCDPSSLVQGHAVWHVLNAVAAALIYPYLRSERIWAQHAAGRERPA